MPDGSGSKVTALADAAASASATTTHVRSSGASVQMLTFVIADEEYGVDILRVQEIREWSPPMPLPNAPAYVRGVINIRGDIVPITDLRHRMGLTPTECGPTTAVVVLRDDTGPHPKTMGILVDAMSDVTSVPADKIAPAPVFGSTDGAPSLTRGIATVDDKMIAILDVGTLFAI